jgi:hypothetical protein
MADAPNTPIGGKIGTDDQQARNRTHQHYTTTATGNGTQTLFPLTKTPSNASQIMVYVNGLRMTATAQGVTNDYSVNGATVVFTSAPANAVKITFDLVSS